MSPMAPSRAIVAVIALLTSPTSALRVPLATSKRAQTAQISPEQPGHLIESSTHSGAQHARAAAIGLALLPSAALATSALDDPTGIAQAFAFVTFVPQNFWLLIVFAPNWKVTRSIFEPLWPLCIVALAHLFIVGQVSE